MRQRIHEPLGQPFIDAILRPRLLAEAETSLPAMIAVNKAHLVMLRERTLIPEETAAALARGLKRLELDGLGPEQLDPALEDLYANLERALALSVGEEATGWLHLARSRNDLWATVARMNARASLDRIAHGLLELRDRFLKLAHRDAEVLIPGYTHLQPAQPMTAGFYFLGVEQALARDSERLDDAYHRVNRCPLGAAAFAGTSFPIDRELTARLLGFSTPLMSALDAVASRDYVLEILSSFSILAMTLSRLAEDLYFWSSAQPGFVEFSGAVAVASSIMPQKKNVAALEHLKGRAGHTVGALMAALAATKGTHFMHARDTSVETVLPLTLGEQSLTVVLQLTEAVIESLTIRRDVSTRLTAEDFSTVTDLAEALVREAGLPFRVAHEVCATLVRAAIDAGRGPASLTAAEVNAAASLRRQHAVTLSDESVRAALDPLLSVRSRRALGGTAPDTVRASVERATAELTASKLAVAARRRSIASSLEELNRRCEALQVDSGR
jgi:argininosuccinate lyase